MFALAFIIAEVAVHNAAFIINSQMHSEVGCSEKSFTAMRTNVLWSLKVRLDMIVVIEGCFHITTNTIRAILHDVVSMIPIIVLVCLAFYHEFLAAYVAIMRWFVELGAVLL